ncbi:TPA: hypothetical protein U0908_001530 [Streptococcus suis 14A]|uniref:hypothetical protein n=1 Tax=Streptococcus suis TaxID=1307 RepID=UPI0004A78D69|nr:hypothetical protein [Streptococcus suis]HEM3199333.1 hypothetical protein [Streptococcus suis 14A]
MVKTLEQTLKDDSKRLKVPTSIRPYNIGYRVVSKIGKGHYPKKLVENCVRKYKRINDFLINIESDSILRSCFIICHSAYGDEQFDGEYCDQSGGYSGDDFHGVYYYPIGENLYFAYNYEC